MGVIASGSVGCELNREFERSLVGCGGSERKDPSVELKYRP